MLLTPLQIFLFFQDASYAAPIAFGSKIPSRYGYHGWCFQQHLRPRNGVSGLHSLFFVRNIGQGAQSWKQKFFLVEKLSVGKTRKGFRSAMHMMPIGIPKVAYRIPGSPSAEWIDIYNRLYRERIIFVSQELDDEFANQLIGIMLYLDSEDSSKPIYLYINCPGGSVISGLAIYDTMQHIKSDVATINVGLAASMASFLLAGGTKGKRFALPHSRTMIHQPMGGAQGQAEDIKIEAAQILRVRKNIVDMYSRMTGLTSDRVNAALDRDKFMSASEAKSHGLIDHIIELKNDEDTFMFPNKFSS
ncbi:ATP-dependent Clp endopeptidase, proteolytic subunit ClpP domain-containing protein [Cardiosporidium cionae]|uniref:ATP-dependent Clp protease proteolytic subunit n=1 Tax=Cardiosporidium cionae TaxID=476202 RepID=A0ABQ7J551_9APIC|nr:ATP-dependent Clp endopeptidase, proteolytic subunit ClpP domain-containing protein [Cardiosporidium cionae]|eukprot:KAF8819112.1 ATP-dependent Clp endopeptidase, proteolytic subunit ClpP domain-containing protein [Cardiosporidium cionae]